MISINCTYELGRTQFVVFFRAFRNFEKIPSLPSKISKNDIYFSFKQTMCFYDLKFRTSEHMIYVCHWQKLCIICMMSNFATGIYYDVFILLSTKYANKVFCFSRKQIKYYFYHLWQLCMFYTKIINGYALKTHSNKIQLK